MGVTVLNKKFNWELLTYLGVCKVYLRSFNDDEAIEAGVMSESNDNDLQLLSKQLRLLL